MHNRSSKRPTDTNQLAKLMVDIASGETTDPPLLEDGRNAAAVMLGRRGGLKGGIARAVKLPAEERKRIAQIAARARWHSGAK